MVSRWSSLFKRAQFPIETISVVSFYTYVNKDSQ